MRIDKIKLDRDLLIDALALWMRWRGHAIPHNMLSQHFPPISGEANWSALQKAGRSVGIHLSYKKRNKVQPKPESFPLIAVMGDGTVSAIRQMDMQGRMVSSQVGGDAAIVSTENIVGWLQVSITSKRLHQQILGANSSGASWFWDAFTANWWAYLQAAIATGFASLLALSAALYSMQVYDRVIPSDSTNTLMVLTIGVVIVYVLELILRSFRAYVVDYAGKKVDLDVSEKVFNQGIGIRMESRPQHTGTFISQLREHESLRDFVTSAAIFTLADFPFLIIFLVAMWLIGGNLVFVPLVVIPALIIFSALMQWPMMKLSREHIRESNARSGLLIESIEGAETLKTLNAEWRMRRRWRELTELVSGTSMRVKSISNFTTNFASTVQSLLYIAIVALGALMIRDGNLTAGALIACSILAGRAVAPVSQIIGLLTRIYQVRASAQTLDKIMGMPIDRPSDANFLLLDRCQGNLSLANVQFSYGESDVVALNIPKLDIAAGERVALLGRTGSGKSTLLRLLSGLYMPTKGRVLMDGVDIHQIDPSIFRHSVGYMTQDVRLFSGTLKDNLLLGAGDVSDDRMLETAKVTGIDRYLSYHPKGFDMPIYEGGGGLSGGQKQAVGLARLMLADPGVFLLDEPTAAMDQQTENEFIQRFSDWLGKDRSLVIATHKPSILSLVSRIIVLEQGQVLIDGPRDQVLQQLSTPVTHIRAA
ncbi:type I secretion system permease/ATPase [Methylotenera sp. G11]|uniref:type I secretion system permease/ATPase n=1 Tax=Methylotenera sp. G11 TaxID=1506585 RepID=UPI000A40D92E|nr:type I secretion system permease/ATPase [Methylotenera sp. G11]